MNHRKSRIIAIGIYYNGISIRSGNTCQVDKFVFKYAAALQENLGSGNNRNLLNFLQASPGCVDGQTVVLIAAPKGAEIISSIHNMTPKKGGSLPLPPFLIFREPCQCYTLN